METSMSNRNVFGWDLPPGVTQRMIDESYGFADPSEEIDELETEIEKTVEQIHKLNKYLTTLHERVKEMFDESQQP
jgi:predicted transcriptional regulator